MEEKVLVGARGSAEREVYCPESCIACYNLTVDGGMDIGLEVLFAPSGSKTPAEARRYSRLKVEGGASYAVLSKGKLLFKLDNSFSMMRGKSVQLSVQLGTTQPFTDAEVADSELMNHHFEVGMKLFFTNRFGEAEKFFATEKHRVPIFSLGYAAMAFMRALMTWAPDDIELASARLKQTHKLAETWMPREGVVSSLRGLVGAASSLSPRELEGTLIHAEASLLTALLALMEESLFALVRCGMQIRSGWNMLTVCDRAMGGVVASLRDSPEITLGGPSTIPAEFARKTGGGGSGGKGTAHIVGGVLFDMGTFNCVASILPPIVLRVIAIFGFPCDRAAGMAQLRAGLETRSPRMPLCALIILAMRVLLPSFHSGDVSEHVGEASAVIETMLQRFPGSALFLWMAGRLARMQGDAATATTLLVRCAAAQTEWRQLGDLCEYELAWCHAFLHEWRQVRSLFSKLQVDNSWSRAFYAYMQAVAELQLGRPWAARAAFADVMRLWASGSRKLGNKVISAEQYAVRRAAEFLCLTCIPGAPDDPELLALVGAHNFSPRLPLPETVPVGSPAHAALLGAPLPLPGLEVCYLFNSAPQMDDAALLAGIAQVDAVLGAVANGSVFDTTSPVWSPRQAAGGPSFQSIPAAASEDGTVVWRRADGSAISGAELSPAGVTELLDGAVAGGLVKGMPLESSSRGASSPAPAPSPTAGASSGGGGSRLGRLVSTLTLGAVGSSGGGSGSSQPLPAYGRPSPIAPVHTVAVAALVRGALCASLGRVDEAAAAFSWVATNGRAGRLSRELHVYGYALYETGVLFTDGVKALKAGAGEQGAAPLPPAAAAPAATTTSLPARAAAGAASPPGADPAASTPAIPPASTLACALRVKARHARLLSSALLHGKGASECGAAAKEALKLARDTIREDFNWKLRLQLRVFLSLDELRKKPGHRPRGKGVAGPGGVGGGGDEADGGGMEPDGEEEEEEEDDGDLGEEAAGAEEEARALEQQAEAEARQEALNEEGGGDGGAGKT